MCGGVRYWKGIKMLYVAGMRNEKKMERLCVVRVSYGRGSGGCVVG